MDLTSLLNVPTETKTQRDSEKSVSSSPGRKDLSPVVTILPTPSPERTSSRRGSDTDGSGSRRPWNAGGYKIPTSIETESCARYSAVSPSPSRQLDSPVSRERSVASGRSRQTSMDSSAADTSESQAATPSMNARTLQSVDDYAEEGRFAKPRLITDRSPTSDGDTGASDLPGYRSVSELHSRHDSARSLGWDEHYSLTANSPGASRHKFSDSRSSLSSYESSHSRISSVTTVSAFSSIASTLTEMPLLEDKLASSPEPKVMPTLTEPRRVPLIEQHGDAASSAAGDSGTSSGPARPSSPSDAILNIRDSTARNRNDAEIGSRSAAAENSRLLASPRFHKRAISAPDFAPASTYSSSNKYKRRQPALPPLHQNMVPPVVVPPRGNSYASDSALRLANPVVPEEPDAGERTEKEAHGAASLGSTQSNIGESPAVTGHASYHEYAAATSPEEPSPGPDNRETTPEPVLRCMFVENCNTGSNQLRKAISHFFGRNKSCTKLIPKEVWVYFCRKHYQRCRYRNAKTYPDNQIGYVITQIERIKDWDVGNQQKGSSTRIKHWQFALRKREKNRLQHEPADPEDDEFDLLAASDITPPPQWVLDAVNSSNYSTDDILGFAQRLQREIREGHLGGIPEVEFLPMIEGGKQNDSGKAASKKTRKQSRSSNDAKAVKRKADDFPGLPNPLPPDINATFASRADAEDFDLISPSEKRLRLDGSSNYPQHQSSHLPPAPRFSPAHPPRGFSIDNAVPARAPNVVPMFQQGIGQTQTRYGHGYNSASSSQFSLPSISSQLGGGLDDRSPYFQHGAHDTPGAQPNSRSHYRPSHQRSNSAFTPVNRPTAAFARPSSSGHDAPLAQPQFQNGQRAASLYGAESQTPFYGGHPASQYGYGHDFPRQYPFDHGTQPRLDYSRVAPQQSDLRQQPVSSSPPFAQQRAAPAAMGDGQERFTESAGRPRRDAMEEEHGVSSG